MADVKSFYVTNDFKNEFKQFLEIKNTKNISEGHALRIAIKDFNQKHKKKTENNILNYVKDPNFIKLPAFFDDSDFWRNYCIKTTDRTLKDIENQAQIIQILANFLLKFDKKDREHKKSINIRQMMAFNRGF